MYYANQELFILIATLLWAADVRPTFDKLGHPMLPSPHELIDKGIILYVLLPLPRGTPPFTWVTPVCRAPAPFACTITPRFADSQVILESTLSVM